MLTNKNFYFGVILTILATICWGGGTVLTKYALNSTTNDYVFFFVQLVSAWLFSLFFVFNKLKLHDNKELKFAWLGIFEPGLAYALGIIGLQLATATQAVIIQAAEGFMIVAISFLLFREKISLLTIILGILLMVGVILVSVPIDGLSAKTSWNIGILWIILGTLAAAFYVVLSSKLVNEQANPLLLIFWQLSLVAFIMFLVIIFRGELSFVINELRFSVIISGVVTYALSFQLYLLGMKYIPVALSAFLLCLIPIFGVLFSLVFLNERLNLFGIVGFIIVLVTSFLLARVNRH